MKKRVKKSKNKAKVIGGIVFIIALLGLAGYGIYYAKLKKELANKLQVSFKQKLQVEINSEAKYSDYVTNIVNGELVNGETVIDTSKLGKVTLKYIFKNKDDEEENKELVLTVVDTTPPVIEASKELSSYINAQVDLIKSVKVTDNSGEEIVPKVVGEYNNAQEGKYELKYEAIDSSGNKVEYDFILNIVSDPNNRTFTTSKGFLGKVVDGITYIDGVLIANKTYTLPASYAPGGLLGETNNAFARMRDDAANLGYTLTVGSGFRSYETQNYLYNNYAARDGVAAADRYSARAGHSEHQTGLAFDVCEHTLPGACINNAFDGTEQAKWINDNCYKYGLILRYPSGKEEITGYMYESWHLRYVGVELATKLYNGGSWITLEEYFGIDSKYS